MIKIAFFDIDGTILSHTTNSIPSSTIEAFKLLHEKGILCVMATGRHTSELKDLPLNDIHFDAYITINGQLCFNNQESIYESSISKNDISNIYNLIKKYDFPCAFIEKEIMYLNKVTKEVRKVQKSINTDVYPIKELSRVLSNTIYQVVPYEIDNKLESLILEKMPSCKATRWASCCLDIIPKIGGKDLGIKKVLDYYSIDLQDTIAFGDGDNDIDMFKLVNTSVAMGNSTNNLKKHATYITDHIDNDGLYKALKYFKII
ncbi:MAG: Cof-type HAD-IIB family hydrolase [Thomasclavelia sp.]|nr:Cof-type HAD-IIB family hydrolase [Thomasclavelia sp.]